MALVTAQQRQTLRLPTPDLSVDSIDQLALLGIWQVESTQATISANQKRWILRLPVIDAAVDELDAWGFLQLPASGGGGNQTEVFSLNWFSDPTWLTSEPQIVVDGAMGAIIRGFSVGFIGIAEDRPAGGFGSVSAYNASNQRKRDREERLKRLRAEIKGLNRWR